MSSTCVMRCVSCLLSFAYVLASPVADTGFEELFKDSLEEVFPEQCQLLDDLPHFLDGTFVIQSTYQYSMGERNFMSWLDAFWKIHTLEFRDGHACYKTRGIRTNFYNKSVHKGTVAGGVLFLETEPPRTCFFGGLCNVLGANDNNFAVTYRIQDDKGGYRYSLMTDTELHLDFDVSSLVVIGKREFSDHLKKYQTDMLKGGGTHLQCQAGMGDSSHDCAGDLYGVVFESGTIHTNEHFVDLYRLRNGSPDVRELVASIPMPFSPGSFHSFGLTDNYAILPLQPYSLDSSKMLKGADIMDSIINQGNTTKIFLVNLHNGTIKTFSFERPFFYVHVVNAWQNATCVIFDVSAFSKPSFTHDNPAMVLSVLRNKSARDAASNVQTVRRYTLDLQSGAVRETFLTNGPSFIDFPKVRADRMGRPYCIYYGVEWKHNGKEYGSWALRKHNICSDNVQYFYSPGTYVSEAQFVASGGPEEDDGFLLTVRSCGLTNSSAIVILDAKTMKSIKELKLPYYVGWYGHSAWYASAASVAKLLV